MRSKESDAPICAGEKKKKKKKQSVETVIAENVANALFFLFHLKFDYNL